ncbi:hypothetical protein Ga0609869_003018 [Rhodovulum iodosum]|uniref:Uncharacterized protein n=1 Tax=Rhodovulum iodosum TaxID=68291 RepID=A0ABV3XWB4_9RHOB|nr:hypothetical protein [Rhodovulum robiginosum]RSK36795.1 hypothetical protein EJA01_04680 [Rhodovulum robiginosum]
MYDPQMQEFQGRLRRVDKMHRRGYGFEAAGTLGRSAYARRAPVRVNLLRPAMFVVAIVIVTKAVFLSMIGEGNYNERLARLEGASVAERAGAYIMQVDPATALIADQIRAFLPRG